MRIRWPPTSLRQLRSSIWERDTHPRPHRRTHPSCSRTGHFGRRRPLGRRQPRSTRRGSADRPGRRRLGTGLGPRSQRVRWPTRHVRRGGDGGGTRPARPALPLRRSFSTRHAGGTAHRGRRWPADIQRQRRDRLPGRHSHGPPAGAGSGQRRFRGRTARVGAATPTTPHRTPRLHGCGRTDISERHGFRRRQRRARHRTRSRHRTSHAAPLRSVLHARH